MLLFWMWLGLSVLIYARRVITTGSMRANQKEGESKSSTRRSRAERPTRPTIDEELAAMAPPPSTTAPGSEHRAPIQPPSGSQSHEAGVTTRTDDAPLARSLAEALAGIMMPCELAPLVTTEHIDSRNMLFATTGHSAESVGTSVADELERLNYTFATLSRHTIQARRGGTVVEITVHPDKATAAAALAGRASGAPDDAVLVEFQLR